MDIKVQVVLQFGVSRGLRLAQLGRLYQRDAVSEFDAGTLPVRSPSLQQSFLLAQPLQPLLLGVGRHLVLELGLFYEFDRGLFNPLHPFRRLHVHFRLFVGLFLA